jgi:nodulation protein E
MRRVAITGMGAICALGKNVAEFAQALAEGRPGIGPIESADVSQIRFQNGAEVKGIRTRPILTTAAPTSSTASRNSR